MNLSNFFLYCLVVLSVKILYCIFVNNVNRCLTFYYNIFLLVWIWCWTLDQILFYFYMICVTWCDCVILRKSILKLSFIFLIFLINYILLTYWACCRPTHNRVFKWIFGFLLCSLLFVFQIFLIWCLLSLKQQFFSSLFHK